MTDDLPNQEDPEKWLDEYGNFLFAYAVSRVSDREVAEDLVQETFLSAVKATDGFEGRSTVRTWLVGILRNKIFDHFRRNRRVQTTGELDTISEWDQLPDFNSENVWSKELLPWPKDPAGTLLRNEFWQTFAACREKLPPLLIAAFTLREIEQRGSDEVCEILGITNSNLAVRIYRARMLLRRCLEENWFD